MKKQKKNNIVFPSICLIVGALITVGTTFYISYNIKPQKVSKITTEEFKYTIVNLDYHFDYENSEINDEMLNENKNETINAKEETKKIVNSNVKETNDETVNKTTVKENTNNKNDIVKTAKEVENTNNVTDNTNNTSSNETEAKKEPILEFTAILEKDVPENGFNKVLEKYSMTEDELYTIIAIVGTEGGGSNYIEAYAIINVIYNRTQSKRWSSYVTSLGNDGNTLYGQATAKGQFSVYQNGTYKGSMGNTTTKAYAAVINFLLDENIMHDYLSFRPASANVEGVMYNQKGNKYLNELSISDHK